MIVSHCIFGQQMVLLADYAAAIGPVYKESRINKEKAVTMNERTKLCKASRTVTKESLHSTAIQWSRGRADP